MGCVFNVFGQNIEPVDLRRQTRRDRGLRRITQIAHFSGGARRVRTRLGDDPPPPQEVPALAQTHDVAVGGLDVLQLGPSYAHQLEADGHEMFGNDLKRRRRQQMVDIRHPAGDRVFHRDHGQLGLAAGRSGKHVLERRAGQRLKVRIDLAASDMGVGAQLPLEGDLVHWASMPPASRRGQPK